MVEDEQTSGTRSGLVAALLGLRGWSLFWAFVIVLLSSVVVVQAVGVTLRSPFGTDDASIQETQLRPAEFLYLDDRRVLAYLAEMQGGTTTSQQLSHKLTNSISGKLALKGLFEAGGSSQEEDVSQRVVTPTAASSYIELFAALDAQHKLRRIRRCLECIQGLEEGEFVLFHTDSMLPPVYVNPYLAVRQSATLSALFPMPSSDVTERETVAAQREAAMKFAKQVGYDPRIVFALRPNEEREKRDQYLLPLDYRQLTNERSLVKYGGGEFAVLGKVVRIFPEPGRTPGPNEQAYVDSPTRETWRRPLKGAISMLLCRANPACLHAIHDEDDAEERAKTIEEARREMNSALIVQSQIHRRGAVIIPIAIYK
jgi:hypothetical protein